MCFCKGQNNNTQGTISLGPVPYIPYPRIAMSRSGIWYSMRYHIAGDLVPEVPKRMGLPNHRDTVSSYRSRYTEKFPNPKTDYARGFGGNFQLSIFFQRKLLFFWFLCCRRLFLELLLLWLRASITTPSCLTFPIPITPPLRTPSVITSRTTTRATQRELALDLLAMTSRKQERSKRSVITSMLINRR